MIGDKHDWLQDYLDDRLPESERARAEALLRADPELNRQVREWQDVRQALREDTDELSPGFYARTRDRFEQSRPGRLSRGLRMLSWETAGLAAAVVIAVAVFAPDLMRRGGPTQLPPTSEGIRFEDAVGEDDDLAPGAKSLMKQEAAVPAAPEDDTGFAPSPTEPRLNAAVREKKKDAARNVGENESFAAAPAREPRPIASAPSPIELQERLGEGERTGRQRKGAVAEIADLPAPVPASPRAKVAKERAQTQLRQDKMMSDVVTADARLSDLEEVAADFVVLSPGVAPDGIRVIENMSDWAALLRAHPTLSVLGNPNSSSRLILVGRDEGVDCATLTVDRESRGYRIRIPGRAAAAGCAFLLPRDALPVSMAP